MKLRTYQREAVDSVINGVKRANLSQLLILPTGSGKTVIFSTIARELGLKPFIVSHTCELKRQNMKTCRQVLKKDDFLSETIQWAFRQKNIEQIKSQEFDMLIVDEAHHACSRSYNELIDHFKKEKKLVLGCTATPFRNDNQSIEEIFPYIAYSRKITDLIREGYLCDIKGFRVMTHTDLSKVSVVRGEYNLTELEHVINTENRNDLICESYKKILKDKKTVVFCVSIFHSERVAEHFRKKSYRCAAIHGELSKEERERILKEFRSGKIQILTNCQLLTEGFDEPSIEALMMARPTKSASLYIQMIGRGLRLYPDKKKCIVVELTDNDHDICSFPTMITGINCDDELFDKFKSDDSLTDLDGKIKHEHFGKKIIIKEMNFIKKYSKNFTEKATHSQKIIMKELGINFIEPLSYEIAEIIINNHLKRIT